MHTEGMELLSAMACFSSVAGMKLSPINDPDPARFLACHVQRSLVYLDISVKETSPICRDREEPFIKRLKCCWDHFNTSTMDSLDLSNDHRVITSYETSCFQKTLFDILCYQKHMRIFLADHIMDYVMNSKDKIRAMRRHLTLLQMIVLSGKSEKGASVNVIIFTCVMEVLIEHCMDSDLVVNVLTSLSSMNEFVSFMHGTPSGSTEIIEYVMYQCQKARFDLWGVLSHQLVQVTQDYPYLYRMKGKTQELLSILLKFGVSTENAACLMFCDPNLAWFRERLQKKGIETDEEPDKRETLQYILSCFTFLYIEKSVEFIQIQECIRLIWQCLPDAYHSEAELKEYMSRRQIQFNWLPLDIWNTSLKKLCNWYINEVSGETLGKLQPRSLQQLCRVTIRKELAKNFQLPGGIASLGAPSLIQNYLRLEW